MYAGFDIGGTSARGALFSREGDRLATERAPTRDAADPEAVAGRIADMMERLLEASPGRELDAIGVGLAGQLDASGQTVRNSPNLGWRNVPFANLLDEAFGDERPPAVLANDLNASLCGEHSEGALTDVDDALAIFVGTGVGGALLVDGRLAVGSGGVAGEIGHAKIEPGGRLCGCGERGCIEAYAGGIHLERRTRAASQPDPPDELLESDGTIDLEQADARARSHDTLDEIWQRATDGLAVVAANACTLLDPAVLLIGGGVVEHCAYFRELLTTKLPPLVLDAARDDLEIRRPALGDASGLVGAARLAARRRGETT